MSTKIQSRLNSKSEAVPTLRNPAGIRTAPHTRQAEYWFSAEFPTLVYLVLRFLVILLSTPCKYPARWITWLFSLLGIENK